jgi:C4-dicarboxylate-specific signal transduction histidine kinase
LLSTNLCRYEEERRDLAELVRAASERGVALLAFGPGGAEALGIPLHESLTRTDVDLGGLAKIVDRSRARANVDRALLVLAHHDRLALGGRLSRSLSPALSAWIAEARRELTILRRGQSELDTRSVEVLEVLLQRIESGLNWISEPTDASSREGSERCRLDAVLTRAIELASTIGAVDMTVVREHGALADVVVDEGLLRQFLVNVLLVLSTQNPARVTVRSYSFSGVLVLELASPVSPPPGAPPAAFLEPFGVAHGVHGLGLWAGRRLLSRWRVAVHVSSSSEGGTCFQVHLPVWTDRRTAKVSADQAACA